MSEGESTTPVSRFPMKFELCPICGDSETVVQVAWAEEVALGRVNPDTPVAASQLPVGLTDPSKSTLLVGASSGILILKMDYCSGCGAARCIEAVKVEGKVGMAAPGGPPPPKNPFSKQ